MDRPEANPHDRPNRSPWPLRLWVVGSALLSVLVFAPLAWHVHNTFTTYREFLSTHQGTGNSVERIHHLNLTLVTRSGELVAGGDGLADAVRNDLTRQLAAAMQELREDAALCRSEPHGRTATRAAASLRHIEEQALHLSGMGALAQGQAILQGSDYWTALKTFNTELDSLQQHCSSRWERTLAREQSRELKSLAGAAAIFLVSLGTWLSLVRSVERRQRRLEEEAAARARGARSLSWALSRCEKLFQQANDAIFLIEPRSGTILDTNDRAASLLGMSPDDLRGRPLSDFAVALAAGPGGSGNLTGTAGQLAQRCFRRSDGTLLTLEVSSQLVVAEDAPVLQCIGRDVTERNRLQQELFQAQKMECVGRVASGIVHDFANLLLAIRGHVTMAEAALDREHPSSHHMRQVELASAQAVEVARSLLTFAGRRQTRREFVELGAMAAEVQRLIEPALPGNIRLETRVPREDELWIRADKALLEQALLNLGLNAKEALVEGGLIRLDLERREDRAVIEIRDNGQGIPAEVADRIWDPFFTTKSEGPGCGLGLFNVKAALEACQGTLELDSQPGHGTCFRLFLPLAPAPDVPRDEPIPDRPREDTHGSAGQVLLAEPHGFARDVMIEGLREHGFEVVAASGAEPLLGLLDDGLPPDQGPALGILDAGLARAGRGELIELVRQHHPNLPLILLHDDWRLEAEDEVDPLLFRVGKPFEILELCRLALNLTRQHRVTERSP